MKIAGEDEPLPLRSLGEGLHRVFGIALALVNAQGGYLLVDEIESGLHYTALLGLWRLVLETARQLNVQVFATTHSWDCIEAFQQAAREDQREEGVLIRLGRKDGDIVATVFDEDELAIATRERIEVRWSMASPYVFLVEGRDDLMVIEALWRFHQQQSFPCLIDPKDGIERLLADLRVRLKPQDSDLALQRLGVVLDFDSEDETGGAHGLSLAARWASLRDILARSGYDGVPTTPPTSGAIIEQEGRPVVGIWLMPNNADDGMLEDFVRSLIPQSDALIQRAGSPPCWLPPEHHRFRPRHRGKALIHTWLAWQEAPGRPLQRPIRAGYLDANAPVAQQLIAWLKRLFGV